MQALQPAAECMQVQRGVVRIQLQQLQGLEVLLFQLGVALEETRGAFIVLRGEDELEGHMRFNRFFSMC